MINGIDVLFVAIGLGLLAVVAWILISDSDD